MSEQKNVTSETEQQTQSSHRHAFKSKNDRLAWYLDEIDCYKEDMGKWYTVFIRRILPAIVFFFPINNLAFAFCEYVVKHYLGGILTYEDTAFPHVVFLVALLLFIAILVFLPRFATFCEFVMCGAWWALVIIRINQFNAGLISKPLITNTLGVFIAVFLGIFMFMKFVFLVIEIIYIINFRGEKEARRRKRESNNDFVF